MGLISRLSSGQALVAGLLIGAVIGGALVFALDDEESLEAQTERLRDELSVVREQVIAAGVAYGDGPEQEREAVAAVDRALYEFSQAGPELESIDPGAAATAATAIERLRELISDRARPPLVLSQAQVAERLVGGLAGGP